MENQRTELKWNRHECFKTLGEAKNASNRLSLFTGRPSKIEYDLDSKMFWITVAWHKPTYTKINRELGDYA